MQLQQPQSLQAIQSAFAQPVVAQAEPLQAVRQLVHPQQEGLVALVQQAELNLQPLEQQPVPQVPQQALAQQVLQELAVAAVDALIIQHSLIA
jgi:hypothetical protein